MASVKHSVATGKAKRAAIYPRVSTGAQKEQGTSLETQEQQCREHASKHGYVLDEAHVYPEVHTGAELWERPQLTRLREAIRQHEIDVVVVYAIDRLSRDAVHLGVIISEADHHGVAVEFVTEPLDDSPEGQLILYVRGYAAKVEREKIRERCIRGKRARIASGKVHNYGVELYGYRREKTIGKRVIHEAEAGIVRRIFEWYVGTESGIQGIVHRLNEEGIPSPSVGKVKFKDTNRHPHWGKGQVRRILSEPAYQGRPSVWRYRRGGKLRPQEEWVALPSDTAPAIVSPEVWQAARTRMEKNHGESTRNALRPYLLRGLVYCVVCGRKMRSNPDRGRHTYRCSSREAPEGPCGAKMETAGALEERAWAQVYNILLDPSIITAAVEEQQALNAQSRLIADRESCRNALAKLEKQQQKLVGNYRQSESDDEDGSVWMLIQPELAKIAKEKTQIAGEIARLDSVVAEQEAAAMRLDTLNDFFGRWNANLDAFDFQQKRLALEALDVHVFAGKGQAEWRVQGRVPLDNAGIGTTTC